MSLGLAHRACPCGWVTKESILYHWDSPLHWFYPRGRLSMSGDISIGCAGIALRIGHIYYWLYDSIQDGSLEPQTTHPLSALERLRTAHHS